MLRFPLYTMLTRRRYVLPISDGMALYCSLPLADDAYLGSDMAVGLSMGGG